MNHVCHDMDQVIQVFSSSKKQIKELLLLVSKNKELLKGQKLKHHPENL